ncbi:MAG: response regulator [Candidatus Riflebacteria bacterium]|nr:response regulator [Candidatus Riflebacteria bacterium]
MDRSSTDAGPAQLVLITSIIVLLTFSTHLSSSLLAIAQAGVLVLLFGYVLILGRRYQTLWSHGWTYIVIGFNLVTFGGIIDISPHVPFLQSALTAVQSPFKALLAQVLGKMVGPLLVAYGFYRWVPSFLESRVVIERMAEQLQLKLRTQAEVLAQTQETLRLQQANLESSQVIERMAEQLQMKLKTQAEVLAQTQEMLRLQQLNQAVIETVPLGILATGVEGTITHANAALSAITGLATTDILGRPIPEAFERSTLRETLDEASREQHGGPRSTEAHDVCLAGVPRDLKITAARSADGVFVCVIEDITARVAAAKAEKHYQVQLLQNEKLSSIGGLVSGVAHELNNPLTIVVGYADLLTRRPPPQVLLDKALADIKRAAMRCEKIVAGLLIFAQQRAPERTSIDVAEVLEEAVLLRSYQCKVHDIEVVRDYRTVPRTMGDGHQLLQVLFNLINNAYQVLQDHTGLRRLTVSCCQAGGTIRIGVADSGPGVPAEISGKIFDPFFTTKPLGMGTGLGLSVSLGILKAHGGDLRLEYTQGGGALFVCDVPITDQVVLAAVRPVSLLSDYALAGRSILIVDDEEGVLGLCRSYLCVYKMAVDYCANGAEALEMIRKRLYDLVLLDVRMPELGGREMYDLLRVENPQQASRVAFMTGDSSDESTWRFLQESGRPYLLKPFRMGCLDKILGELTSSS